jgi:hypothetical protein
MSAKRTLNLTALIAAVKVQQSAWHGVYTATVAVLAQPGASTRSVAEETARDGGPWLKAGFRPVSAQTVTNYSNAAKFCALLPSTVVPMVTKDGTVHATISTATKNGVKAGPLATWLTATGKLIDAAKDDEGKAAVARKALATLKDKGDAIKAAATATETPDKGDGESKGDEQVKETTDLDRVMAAATTMGPVLTSIRNGAAGPDVIEAARAFGVALAEAFQSNAKVTKASVKASA